MNLSMKKMKSLSCVQAEPQESFSNCNDCLKYIIIDSENEQEVINLKRNQSVFLPQSLAQNQQKKSVLTKSKGSTVANFLSCQNDSDKRVDDDLQNAEREMLNLKKECDFLEKMINDMIQQQAKLQVSLRIRERRESINKNRQNDFKKGFFSHQVHMQAFISNSLGPKLLNSQGKQPISLTTPFASQLAGKKQRNSLQIIKTVQIKNHIKAKRSKQNTTPIKKGRHKKQNTPKTKEQSKAGKSMCKNCKKPRAL